MTLRVAFAGVAAAALLFPAGATGRGVACPRDVVPLTEPPSDGQRAEASHAARRFARSSYAPKAGLLTIGMRVAQVRWARAWPATRFVRSACGPAAWASTLAIDVVFPVMFAQPPHPYRGCDFCAGVTVLVARGEHGWFVWDAL